MGQDARPGAERLEPQPGEEALYGWINSVLDAAAKDPAIKKTLTETAVAAEKELIAPLFDWRNNGGPAGNGWNAQMNAAQWGNDYLNRAEMAKSSMFGNRPDETKYFYTVDEKLNGENLYSITFPKGQVPPVKGFWSVTLYNEFHLFEANASTARALAQARIVIVNGADYDQWMDKLISANKAGDRAVIVAAQLAGKKPGDNPHLWYNPDNVKALGEALVAALTKADPANAAEYAASGAVFARSLDPLDTRIAAMRKKYSGAPVAASEPVFGYMAERLGLDVREQKFALAIMNNTEPGATEVGVFENDLRDFKVKALLFNRQASEASVQRLVALAKQQAIPVIGISETEPAGTTYQAWMMGQLDALDKALGGPR